MHANPLLRWLGPPVRALQLLGGWALVAISVATLYDIVARRLLGHSVQGVAELGAYLLAIVSAFGFASALLQKAHSRVDFLFGRFPPLLRAVLNLLAAVSLAGLACFAAWHAWGVLDETLLFESRSNTPLATPMWIPQGLWWIGLLAFAIVAVIAALHAAFLFVADRTLLERWYGPLSVEGQIEVETQGAIATPAEETRR